MSTRDLEIVKEKLLEWIKENVMEIQCTEGCDHTCIEKDDLIEKIEELF